VTVARNIPDAVRALQIEAADPDHSVFVSANAGSGKTHVLAQRVINLLLRGTDPAKILCITFTKAAAANMATRVFDQLAEWTALGDTALDKAIAASTGTVADAAQRARARRLFASALETPGGLKVQTIHAFCTRLLHQFPFEADVAARFTVLDEASTWQLLDELTLDVLLEASAAPDSPLGRALAGAIVAAADQTLKEMIGEAIFKRDVLNAWIKRAGGLPQAASELSRQLGVDPDDALVAAENDFLGRSLIPAAEWPALLAIFAAGSASDQKHTDALEAARIASGRDKIDAYIKVFCTTTLEPRKNIITKKLAEASPQWLERLLAEQDRVCALLARERAIKARDRSIALITIAAEVIARYRAEKDRRALLDYDDLIDKTLALFGKTSAAWVLYKLDLGIDHLLIDEAQDTSPKQWDIIKTVASEFVPGGSRQFVHRTVFAVGDEKQSIFSFQGAAPRAFADNRRHFEQQFREVQGAFVTKRFEYSFRSGPGILGAVDAVFQREQAFQGLTADPVPTVHQSLPDAAPGLVEIWDLIKPDEKREIEGWDAPFDRTSEQSPRVVLARRIAATVTAWRTNGTRPGEVLILVRQRGSLFEAIIRALKDAEIPVAGADRLKLIEHIAVMDLLVLADTVLLPDDDLALATLLKSPLFGLNDDQLFELAWNRKGSLRAALRAKAGEDEFFSAVDGALDDLGVAARAMSPFAFYAHVLGARKGRARFFARLGYEAADALDEFLNLALDYERRETPSLQGFAAWLRGANAEVKRDMEMDRDEVRVMTVHGAKGLEARHVILADTITKPSGPRDPRLLSLEEGSAAPIVWATARGNDVGAMAQARDAAQRATADEYRRLLYVAMTRAIERLVVCGAKGPNKIPDGCWYHLVEAALDPLSVREPADAGGGEVRRFYKSKPQALTPPGDTKSVATATAVPAWLKQTVKPERPSRRVVRPSDAASEDQPRFAGSGDRDAALKRGTLVHRLMQSLPDIAPERREEAARRYLARAGQDFDEAARVAMAGQVLRLLADPSFAALFAPGSRAEVSIAGKLTGRGGETLLIAGQIDRLAVTADEVLIADYKTNRPAPAQIADVPKPYLRQLALYRAVLQKLYPARNIRAALIWTEVPESMELSADVMDASLAGHLGVSAP
jgi:ATP-dependent helicase/nuclease subunit A